MPLPKQEDTTATTVAAADLEKEVPKQEDTTSSGAAQAHDDEVGFLDRVFWFFYS